MEIVGVSIKEIAVCNKCGNAYTDKGSIEMVKKWIEDGYAPCPILSCPGEFEITLEFKQV